jgi:hypothetical protein
MRRAYLRLCVGGRLRIAARCLVPRLDTEVVAADDLGQLLTATAVVQPSTAVAAAAERYGGAELRASEGQRAADHERRVAGLRRRARDRAAGGVTRFVWYT